MKHRSAEASRYSVRRVKRTIAAAASMIGIAAAVVSAQTAPITVTFHAGRVTLAATDAPAADVFREWARVGNVEIAGLDQLSTRRVTLTLADIAEQKAVEQIIGDGYGFLGIGKSDPSPDTSQFGRLFIVGTKPPSAIASPALSSAPPDPESRYEYSRPRNATVDPANYGGVGIGATTPNVGEPPAEPERAFDYPVPARVREAQERQRRDEAAKPPAKVTPAPSKVPFVDPELRFEYYRPRKSIPPKKENPEEKKR